MADENGTKRVYLGPRMIKLLEDQRKRIDEKLYGIRESSYAEAGEILAMKFKGEI